MMIQFGEVLHVPERAAAITRNGPPADTMWASAMAFANASSALRVGVRARHCARGDREKGSPSSDDVAAGRDGDRREANKSGLHSRRDGGGGL